MAANGRKITQFKPITDNNLADDKTLWVAGDSLGLLYKPTSKQVKQLITNIVNIVAPQIFNQMWATIKASEQQIAARWTFPVINLDGVNDTPREGDIWYTNDPKKVNVQKVEAEEVVTSKTNPFLEDPDDKERLLSTDGAGAILAIHELIEEITTDIDIVNSCMAATYNSGNRFNPTIIPANNKTLYKGQMCISIAPSVPYVYKAINNNSVIRMLLG